MNILDDAFLVKHVNPDFSTSDFVEKCRFIQKKSHIKLNEKKLTGIGEAVLGRNCKVLYLQDNFLTSTTNLKQFTRLTHLYLQNNWIEQLDGFQLLTYLVKLYLGRNRIAVLENLENCSNLEEIHIGNQNLGPTDKLVFDPRTMEGLAESLLVLDVSTNGITNLKELEKLTHLEILDISRNNLEDADEVASSLKKMEALQELNCELNPLCSSRNYKGTLIMAAEGLKSLNGRDVSGGAFSFYKTLHESKINKEKAKFKKQQKMDKAIQKAMSELSSDSSNSSVGDEQKPTEENEKPLIGMGEIRKIIRELPTGLRAAINKPEDYTEHIAIINKRENLKK